TQGAHPTGSRAMPIDLTVESLIRLEDATKLIPPARSGKRTHFSTVWRWVLKGVNTPNGRRVRLEATRLGNRWFTSREALQRFTNALTPRFDVEEGPRLRTPTQQRKASERAARRLEEMGI